MSVADEFLERAVAAHKAQRYAEAAQIYNALLNRAPFDEGLLFLLSDLYLRVEKTGLAVNLLSNLVSISPDNAPAWCNLGIGFQKEQRYDEAQRAWTRALEIAGDTVEVCSNMAGLYADRCMPHEALSWLDRALACEPQNAEAHWQRSLALLTLRRWADGWPQYEYRQKLDSWDARPTIAAPAWDWRRTEHLYIHGEQGVGDEVMFLSCLDEAIAIAGGRVTLELNKRVAPIARQTWPSVRVIEEPQPGDYTATIPLASLAVRLRTADDDFRGAAYLKPCPARVSAYRKQLEALGPRPWIAVTWFGGAKQTRIEDRSIPLDLLRPTCDRYTSVSAQYEHTTDGYAAQARESLGLPKLDDDCLGLDLAAQAALFAAVDAVVTVQQTAVHVAGAVGARTLAMICKQPQWRYGMEGSRLPWYDSVELIRQSTMGDWRPVIETVETRLADLARVCGAERGPARCAA